MLPPSDNNRRTDRRLLDKVPNKSRGGVPNRTHALRRPHPARATKLVKAVSGGLKGEMSQFRELQAFAQFGTSDLDQATRRQLERGQRATELLKQPQFGPLSMAEEAVVLYALSSGSLDDVPVAKVRSFEEGLRRFLASNHPDLLRDLTANPVSSPEVQERMKSVIATFKQTVPY